MIMKAAISSKIHPEYGQTTILFPIPDSDYDHIIALLESMGIGSPTAQDCRVDELTGKYPILNRLTVQNVNVDELDYLAKRLDSFCAGESEKFQAMASRLCLSDIKDFINLTFCCQRATVISDFSDLERIGKDHALTVSGDSMPMEMLETLDYHAVDLDLIRRGIGAVTPYGVVYDNGMKLEAVVLLTNPSSVSEVCHLTENLDQFDFVAKSDSPKAAGQVTELGYVAYHGSLALEELMGNDLTEQHQEMGGWHNGATRGKGFVQQ